MGECYTVRVGGRVVVADPCEDDPTGRTDPKPVPGRAPRLCRRCNRPHPHVVGANAGLCGYCVAAAAADRAAAAADRQLYRAERPLTYRGPR